MIAKISIENLHLAIQGKEILKDLSLEVDRHETVAIVGANGAGKSSLLRILTGLSSWSKGEVKVLGYAPGATKNKPYIGTAFQSMEFPSSVSVQSVLNLVGAHYKLDRTHTRKIMNLFGIHELAHLDGSKLSGGEKKRIVLYLAFCHDPELVFLDEPTAALDYKYQRILRDYLRILTGKKTIFITSHAKEDIHGIPNRIVQLRDGRITGDQTINRSLGSQTIQFQSEKIPVLRDYEPIQVAHQCYLIECKNADAAIRSLVSENIPFRHLEIKRGLHDESP